MSVAELQARANNLSADILRHKEVLRTLELSKVLLSASLTRPGARHAPMILATICNGWTDIALSTPSLWAAIDADKPISNLASLLDIWLRRAGNRVLSISLPTPLTSEIAAVVARHAHQLKVLQMYHHDDDGDTDFSTAVGPWPSSSLQNIQFQDLLQFLRRSSPPLQQIIVGDAAWLVDWTLEDLEECLSLLSTLTDFECLRPKAAVRVTVQRPLGSPQTTAGHARLGEDVTVQLRQLAADGMSIHVGPEDRNYI
ncbi:hypothetical protein B0H17DRAFT_1145908 [Mycena rosella]|uniref:Uncharacterized protein n=1 Tax=Mycena rosella TaxID=1033263 RepID=A0AAD7CPZ2_MYCRO|nr:hypothetical protein B0H17DRAFT_1145908 [Mycena rosella]